MSSSSIEVMGGEDMQMMIIGADGSTSQIDAEEDNSEFLDEENNELDDMDELDQTPGSIIFSPQDTLDSNNSKSFSKIRKKGKSSRKGSALTIKMEEGVDYSRITLPVTCEICGKLMANGRILVQHMATHSVNKAYQCPHCPKSFTRMVHLQGHLVFHGIQKQFECPVCHQRFSRQDCVRVHMRLHDKTKCAYCSVCHKAFLTVGALNIHLRIHRGEKPFKCHLCGKCFTQKNHVITHIKRHTNVADTPFQKKLGPRMFQCEHCPRSFIRLSDYERHVQWNHGAVSDTNMVAKTPGESLGLQHESLGVNTSTGTTLEDMLLGHDVTLNSKVRKKTGAIFRRTMCSIGTQTDNDGGHVIIPRKYNTATSMTSAGTQMSAPPTPRHEDDIYENEIYDEGMDRNYSSDEDELIDSSDSLEPNITPTPVSSSTQEAGSTANDEAFDAVMRKSKSATEQSMEEDPENEKVESAEELAESDKEETVNESTDVTIEKEPCTALSISKEPILQEVTISEGTKAQISKPVVVHPIIKQSIFKSPNKPVRKISNDTIEHDPMIREKVGSTSSTFIRPRPVKILDTFNTKNWLGRGRGRGRSRSKSIIGLTGATHLRLIRKSMMNFITEKTEQLNESIKRGEEPELPKKNKVGTKRVSKAKPHSSDFMCSSKSCEVCNPNILKTTVEQQQLESNDLEQTISIKTRNSKDQSAKLLQFLVSGDSKNLIGTDFRLINENKSGKPSTEELEMAMDASMENPSVSLDLSQSEEVIRNLRQRTEFFSATNVVEDDYASPPVELQSFCIPTYSCKLCGREFRFEGKLHRHIEAVHQNKEIFSPDVKPGRGAGGRFTAQDTNIHLSNNAELPMNENTEILTVPVKQTPQQNPEIEALRSEWDDDDTDSDQVSHEHKPVLTSIVSTVPRRPVQQFRTSVCKMPIVTRDIVRVTNTFSDAYLGGVKLNINKLSGLAEFEQVINVHRKIEQPAVTIVQESTAVVKEVFPDSLDTKCQKLLQKLFNHTLLMNCGLHQEHVSVILGKVLQHYCVKMIEDYGQGQYEVLKYNLWRLIEWKVTMEQMEEFYTEGKSVEEMMDDIMNGRVPIIAHHEMLDNIAEQHSENVQQVSEQTETVVDTVQMSQNQIVLSQVANVLGGPLNLGDGVTQVVLAQDVSPELLQGAHIVTIDPTTGQVLSQVTADQVIISSELGHQIQTIDGQVVTQASGVVTSLPPGSIVSTNIADHQSKL